MAAAAPRPTSSGGASTRASGPSVSSSRSSQAGSLIAISFYKIDQSTHERNLETLKDAAATADQSQIDERGVSVTAGAGAAGPI